MLPIACVIPTLYLIFVHQSSEWQYVAVTSGAMLVSFTPCNVCMYLHLDRDRGFKHAFKAGLKQTIPFVGSVLLGWIVIESSIWLGAIANVDTSNMLVQVGGIVFASVGYPLLKMGCIKAMEPAWRAWTSAAEGDIVEAIRKDMSLTMAYDCLFGVAGRIDVLRQPTFTAFLLSVFGSAGFELGVRGLEAIHLRRKMLKAVGNAAEWHMKSRVSLHVTDDSVREVFNSEERLERGRGFVKYPSEFDLGVSEKPSKMEFVPRAVSVLPRRPDVESLGDGKRDRPGDQSHRLNANRDILSGNPIALIEKPRPIMIVSPKAETQSASANIMSVSVLVKLWGAHRLAETA
ncbi:hypothetical protein HK104_004548, partial [Borealophlyctis nickersoniae]